MTESAITKQNVDDVRRIYFGQNNMWPWCKASEMRLRMKLIEHKPAGVNRHLHMMMLVDYMNHIYEDEMDVSFEDVLSREHYNLLKSRKRARGRQLTKDDIKVLPPSYKIRPSAKQIEEKLYEFYDLKLINDHEIVTPQLLKVEDYVLPDLTPTVSPVSGTTSITAGNDAALLPPPLPLRRGRKRRKPLDSPVETNEDAQSVSSRGSTPSSMKRLRN
ncbi:chromatin modification-related protein EAF7 domain-containing protein [Ditylenchus destructor]|uniref:Chromatin modification-related protein EAF7 domain-containing protein n=1 Tax=Ditylenchus destructor TaxID=166010 RepID=A0AAD4R3N5_9BILA|nr:chromatin modification-related protein EAF7 domain-containing protein [Ditylenchus destructor]